MIRWKTITECVFEHISIIVKDKPIRRTIQETVIRIPLPTHIQRCTIESYEIKNNELVIKCGDKLIK